jgi:hypothetical protein
MVQTIPEPRQGQDRNSSSAEEEQIAFDIALILTGGVVLPPSTTPLAAISALLLLLPGLSGASGASVANAAARLVALDPPALPEEAGVLRAATLSNLSHRGHYAVAAFRRLAGSVARGDDLRQARRKEARFFAQHREAERMRTAGARLNDAAAERWGPILSWNDTGKAKTHRPSHLAADGKNYDVRRPPRSTGGILPGQAPNCDCVPGPPREGVEVMR